MSFINGPKIFFQSTLEVVKACPNVEYLKISFIHDHSKEADIIRDMKKEDFPKLEKLLKMDLGHICSE